MTIDECINALACGEDTAREALTSIKDHYNEIGAETNLTKMIGALIMQGIRGDQIPALYWDLCKGSAEDFELLLYGLELGVIVWEDLETAVQEDRKESFIADMQEAHPDLQLVH